MATTLVYPEQLPFNAPLEQIRNLLDKVGAPYESILAAWRIPPATVAARGLGLSARQQGIVTHELTTAAEIAPYYGVTAAEISSLSQVETFLAKTRTSFADLLALVDQDLSITEQKAGLQVNFFLNQGLGKAWVAIDEKKDELTHLGVAQLDRINRLVRLSRTLGWTSGSVDWALRCVQGGGVPKIDDPALHALSQLADLATELSLDLDEATALLGPIKTYGQGTDGEGTAFDRLFNPPALTERQKPYHPAGNPLVPTYTDPPLQWTPGSTEDADIAALNRVLPGLGLSLGDANLLGLQLYGSKRQDLTVQVLSELYRHAVLSRALDLPMRRYLELLQLQELTHAAAPTADELVALAAAARWMAQAGVTVYQLAYVIRGTPSVYVDPMYPSDSVADWQRELWVVVPGPEAPTVATDITAQEAKLFGPETDLMARILPMAVAAVKLPGTAQSWEKAFLAAESDGKTPKYGPYVESVLGWVSRWRVLARMSSLSEATVASVATHPAAYGVPTDFASISWTAIENIDRVRGMMQRYGDRQKNLLAYIALASTSRIAASRDAASRIAASDPLEVLEKATGWPPAQVEQLLEGPVKDVKVVSERLGALEACFAPMDALGADPSLMATLATLGGTEASARTWGQFTAAAELVMAKTASRYGDTWSTVWSALAGELAVRERDALLAVVLHRLQGDYPDITSARKVYEFLLVDVEMGPETQISYLKEALNAAQLYLQRCRLRLEEGVEDLSHIHDAWWEWMMSYRLWQANREIFVYPENYLI
ncbi:MAG: hypothetical protein MI919_09370, partial [Holophagales bacterium]|nr:hypothetical protein [Holophagales bacterium]